MINYTKTGIQHDLNQIFLSIKKHIVTFVKRLLETFTLWREKSEERKQLAMVDDRLLKDMGITRIDAEQEISKPFWQ